MIKSKHYWVIANISLALIALILIITFFNITAPIVGKAKLILNPEDPLCIIKWQGENHLFENIDNCCLEASQQLECLRMMEKSNLGRTDRLCWTGATTVNYALNNKAYTYCQLQNYWPRQLI